MMPRYGIDWGFPPGILGREINANTPRGGQVPDAQMDVRTGSYGRRVLRPAHDGDVRTRVLQECPGTIEFDLSNPLATSVEARIDAATIWTGEPERDAHLRSADFLDVERYPEIVFRGNQVALAGPHDGTLTGDLTIRGVTQPVTLHVHYLGQWRTPWWEDGVDKGPKTRAGFVATTRINRHDFRVSWNSPLERGGIVVGNTVDITVDVEAIRD